MSHRRKGQSGGSVSNVSLPGGVLDAICPDGMSGKSPRAVPGDRNEPTKRLHESIAPDQTQTGRISRRAVGSDALEPDVSPSEVAVAFVRAAKKLKATDSTGGNIYAFLPAKAGAGATTIALSTAAAVARLSKQRTLLLDFDLRLGITSFLLQLDGHHSVQDALNEATHLDEDLWTKLVTVRDRLDVLGSAPTDLPSESSSDAYLAVLNRAQAGYGAICVDLPGTMERHELETLERAKEIFLVCTSDVAGLHMAKRKALALQKLELGEKISAIVNHAEKRTMLPIADIEKLLQVPVRFTLPSDAKAVACAVQQGAVIQGNSPLAAQIEVIAKRIVGTAAGNGSIGPVRRFIEFFSVSPERDPDFWKRR
jgi:Flp pilus assembly CpaE family ATPase